MSLNLVAQWILVGLALLWALAYLLHRAGALAIPGLIGKNPSPACGESGCTRCPHTEKMMKTLGQIGETQNPDHGN